MYSSKEVLPQFRTRSDTDILDCDLEINSDGENTIEPLHVAAASGLENVTNFLLSRGADVDQTTLLGWTPLMFAARKGNLRITEKLIQHGANVYHRNKLGISVLNMAVASKNEYVMANFLNMVSEETNGKDNTVPSLHMAALSGQVRSVQLLLNCGYKINTVTSSGVSALMLATASGHTEVVSFLLEHGADPEIRNCLQYSALDIAVAKRFETIVNTFYSKLSQKNSVVYKNPEIFPVTSSLSMEQYGWSLPYMTSTILPIGVHTNCCKNDSILQTLDSASLKEKSQFSYCSKTCENANTVPVPPLSPYRESRFDLSFPPVDFERQTSPFSRSSFNVSYNDNSTEASLFSNSAPEISDTLGLKSNNSQRDGKNVKSKEMHLKNWSKNLAKRIRFFVSSTEKENLPQSISNPKLTTKFMKTKNLFSQAEAASMPFVCTRNGSYSPREEEGSSLTKLLTSLELKTFIPLFIRHEIDMEVFLALTKVDLQKIGIECPVVQEKLLTAISMFQK